MEDTLEKKQRMNLLMDLYEDLLTEKQREYLDLYYHEDLSLSEISLIKNVSKNAVSLSFYSYMANFHDTLILIIAVTGE